MRPVGFGLLVTLWLLLLHTVGGLEVDDDFELPTPEDWNIAETNFTEGYNPWMPQYNWESVDTTRRVFVMIAESCLPQDDDDILEDMAQGWRRTCEELEMQCQCRPIVREDRWNVENQPSESIWQGIEPCSWETRRVLDEHRRSLIRLGAVAIRCGFDNPEIYNEARALGVPVFSLQRNPPIPGKFHGRRSMRRDCLLACLLILTLFMINRSTWIRAASTRWIHRL